MEGQLSYRPDQLRADTNDFHSEEYGIYWEGGISSENSDIGVAVPVISFTGSAEILNFLISSTDPLENSNDYGIDLYMHAVDEVERFLGGNY